MLLSNLSYTNKDFNSIYTELLDLVDTISPIWKPGSVDGSNEADPGVLLLKLDALMADKNNYNIDKNILELFPDSVTQYPNARELYEQCGYIMPYYQSASAYVTLNLRKEFDFTTESGTDAVFSAEVDKCYRFPNFLEVTNKDSSIKYVIVDPDISLYDGVKTKDFLALQGSHLEYYVNDTENTIITYKDLDYNNRLYFKETNIAENGIFVQSVLNGSINYNSTSSWKKVDNLLTEPQNTPCYKFGVSRDGNQCYIEFPTDIGNIIGEGIHIDYILTDGAAGNINKKVLTNFFSDNYEIVVSHGSTEVVKVADTDHVYICNYQPSSDGRDPETLEEARKNYERIKNTFKTLVSLSDYNNFILNSDRISNGFVCDRTNDIQHTTKIQTTTGEIQSIHTQVALDSSSTVEMTPFDLKLYMLKRSTNIYSDKQFDLGFELIATGSTTDYNIKLDMDDIKCIQHNFANISPNKIANIQLHYPIKLKILPYNKLDYAAQTEVHENIVNTLLRTLNSNVVEYGAEIDYDTVYESIKESDPRIKSLILEDFDYTPYVVYLDDTGRSQSINLGSTESLAKSFQNIVKAKSVLYGVTPLYDRADSFTYSANQLQHNIKKLSKDSDYLTDLDSPYLLDVGKVTTNTELNLAFKGNDTDGSVAQITLLDNESVYLTTPNYVSTQIYNNYTKYFHNFNASVGKDCIYTLNPDEYIIFFWKEEDNDTAPYYYRRYGGGSIICPNFTLSQSTNYTPAGADSVQKEFLYVLQNTVLEALSINPQDSPVPDVTALVPAGSETASSYTYSQIIAKCKTGVILDGSKQIDIKGKNSITFSTQDNDYNLYFLLNTVKNIDDKPKYQLNFINNEYTLKSGEYLFYAPKDNSSFALLGGGTKLVISQSSGSSTRIPTEITVDARTYEEVLYGKDDLLSGEGLWYTLPTGIELEAIEMKFYMLGSGTTLTCRCDTDLSASGSSLRIDCNGITYPSGNHNFELSYLLEGETIATNLPTFNTNEWEGYSVLNLNCGPNRKQSLIKDKFGRTQSIKCTYKYSETDDNFVEQEDKEIIIANSADETKVIYIQSEYDLNMLGGINVDVTAHSLLGDTYGNSFYAFTESNIGNCTVVDYIAEYSVTNSESSLTFEIPLTINCPPLSDTTGILVPVQILEDLKSGQWKDSANTVYSYLGQPTTEQVKLSRGVYFFSFTQSNPLPEDSWKLVAETYAPKTPDNTLTVRVLPIIKYQNQNTFVSTGEYANELFQTINSLDIEGKFNYGYQVPDNDLISNPLTGSAFLDSNHPYNKCTICKWDHKNSKIQIINKNT